MRVSWFVSHQQTIEFDYFSPISPKNVFFQCQSRKFTCKTLPIWCVSLWCHNHITCETGRLACHLPPPPMGDRLVILGNLSGLLCEYLRKKKIFVHSYLSSKADSWSHPLSTYMFMSRYKTKIQIINIYAPLRRRRGILRCTCMSVGRSVCRSVCR